MIFRTIRGPEEDVPHRLGELAETHRVINDRDRLLTGERLIVAKENMRACNVLLCLLIVASVDGFVGTLEQQVLAVLHVLPRLSAVLPWDHDARSDVVLGLNFARGVEVVTQSEEAP